MIAERRGVSRFGVRKPIEHLGRTGRRPVQSGQAQPQLYSALQVRDQAGEQQGLSRAELTFGIGARY